MQGVLDGSYKPDAIFSSYDQMNSVKGQETQRRQFLDMISPRAFVIMDESHNAGGQGPNSRAVQGRRRRARRNSGIGSPRPSRSCIRPPPTRRIRR